MISRRALLALVPLTLAGCAALPHARRVRAGRFSLQTVFEGKSEITSGRWRLTEAPGVTVLELLTPLQGVLARVEASDGRAVLERPGHDPEEAGSTSELLARVLGFGLETPTLRRWLSAEPDPALPYRTLAPGAFEQSGWTVRRTGDSPLRLRLSLPALPGRPAARLTLVVDSDA